MTAAAVDPLTHPLPGLVLLHGGGGQRAVVPVDFGSNSAQSTRVSLRRAGASASAPPLFCCCPRSLCSAPGCAALQLGRRCSESRCPVTPPPPPPQDSLLAQRPQSASYRPTSLTAHGRSERARVCFLSADRCLEINLIWNQFHLAEIIKVGQTERGGLIWDHYQTTSERRRKRERRRR